MRLDRTHVRIRERNVLEVIDLAMRLFRVHFRPIALLAAVGAAPWILLDDLTTIGLIDPIDGTHDVPLGVQFYQLLAVLVQAPLALLPVTVYLGHAVFDESPSPRRILADTFRGSSKSLVSLGMLRGAIPSALLMLMLPLASSDSPLAVLWVLGWWGLLPLVLFIRWIRPFAPEVIALERPPWSSPAPDQPSFAQRMGQIHAGSFAETGGRGIVFAILAGSMVWVCYVGLGSLWGLAFHHFLPTGATLRFIWPLALWTVAALMTVVRFVNYLDVRIRQEGWEVELLMRAEGRHLEEAHRASLGFVPETTATAPVDLLSTIEEGAS